MAALPLSFITQSSHCLSCGAIETLELVPFAYCNYSKWLRQSFRKTSVKEDRKGMIKIHPINRRFQVLAKTQSSEVQTATKVSTYLFRTEIGGQVKVCVEKNNSKNAVHVEASSLHLNEDDFVMIWGIFRSDSSCLIPLESQNLSLDSKSSTVETQLANKSLGKFEFELEFESTLARFYLSFFLKSKNSEIRSHIRKSFVVPVGFGSGYPAPLGLSFPDNGSMNFALLSRNSEGVVLCLYDDTTIDKPSLEIELDPYVNRTGYIWHASIDNSMQFVKYGYRFKHGGGKKQHKKRVLLDPYCKTIGSVWLGQLLKEPDFDWNSDIRPSLPMEKLLVYRLNVMRFTKDKSSKLHDDIAGKFAGITEKLNYFKDLGVNAILLEPIFPYDEHKGPYYPLHFFSPSSLYGTTHSMKEMVRNLHSNGIEVLLEVVFTRTSESSALIEIDKFSYYFPESVSDLNCNYPVVQQLILECLRHWVVEYHIDGFCFVNASSLLRGSDGQDLTRPPLIEAIAFDPILSKTKIIADSWDPAGKKSKNTRFPHWRRWAEMNTNYCIDVRNFLRGEGQISNFATRLCGSGDLFLDGRGPSFSFNFVARNSGLSLVDLVSFSKDVLGSELSWNCGEEGLTSKTKVLQTRLKQIRNFLLILFVSLGVPVLNMGDECGHSSGGSPSYEDRKEPFGWNALKTDFGIQTTQFISFLATLRTRRNDLFQNKKFLKEENIDWLGTDQSPPKWDDPKTKFLAVILKTDKTEDSQTSPNDMLIAFNGSKSSEKVILPVIPSEMAWFRLVDTALSFPGFFSENGEPVLEKTEGLITYQLDSHSCALFEAKPGEKKEDEDDKEQE